MSWISRARGQFAFFDSVLGKPDWKDKRVLDFGGNVGNLLRDPNCTIKPRNYWCIDVSRDAIQTGKRDFPDAHWFFLDRYNFAFNPTGIAGMRLPELDVRFDFILAYSVFTHIASEEMIETIDELRRLLEKGGLLAVSFFDPNVIVRSEPGGPTTLKKRLEKIRKDNGSIDVEGLLEQARNARRCIIVNDGDLYVDCDDIGNHMEHKSFQTFFTHDFMKELFPEAIIQPPLNGGPHSCCILRA